MLLWIPHYPSESPGVDSSALRSDDAAYLQQPGGVFRPGVRYALGSQVKTTKAHSSQKRQLFLKKKKKNVLHVIFPVSLYSIKLKKGKGFSEL